MEQRNGSHYKIKFIYHNGDTRYYLLTGRSGFAAAHFTCPFSHGAEKTLLVVPEKRTGSGILPGGEMEY
ncbi:MAG: hypothetical protein IMW93_00895 [Thermoanaerobacteraceae bacterium]|nr:hypothetical protein [Thermoanaerobacteraceae bacterium]